MFIKEFKNWSLTSKPSLKMPTLDSLIGLVQQRAIVLSWQWRSLRLLVFCGFFLVLLKYVFEKALIVLLWNFYCTRSRCGLLVFNIWVLMLSWYYKYFWVGPYLVEKYFTSWKLVRPNSKIYPNLLHSMEKPAKFLEIVSHCW